MRIRLLFSENSLGTEMRESEHRVYRCIEMKNMQYVRDVFV